MKQELITKLENLSKVNGSTAVFEILKNSKQSKSLLYSLKREIKWPLEWNDIINGLDEVIVSCALIITDGEIETDELKQLIGIKPPDFN